MILRLRFGKILRNNFPKLIVFELRIYVPPLTMSRKIPNMFWSISLSWKLYGKNFILIVLFPIVLVLFSVDVMQWELTKSTELKIKSSSLSLALMISFQLWKLKYSYLILCLLWTRFSLWLFKKRATMCLLLLFLLLKKVMFLWMLHVIAIFGCQVIN